MAEEINLFEAPKEPSFFVGQVQSDIFDSPDSFYKVLLVSVEDANFDWNESEITVTGSFGDLRDDQTYRFEGKLVDHPKYGRQFQASSYHANQPTSREGIVNFLAGKQFPGIGKKTAEKIVDKLGTHAIDKINADPHVLDGLKLRETVRSSLVENLNANQGMDQIIIGLNDLGFGSNLSSAIFDHYGDETLNVIGENPYQLVQDIEGISFKRADQVAMKMKIPADDERRISAAIIQSIDDLTMASGDTYTSAKPLLQESMRLLADGYNDPIPTEKITQQIVKMEKDGSVQYEEKRIYPASLYKAEWQIAENLHRLCQKQEHVKNQKQVTTILEKLPVKTGIKYDAVQLQAIKTALTSKVMLLTGGPGTGKTTIIKGVVAAFAELNEIALDPNQYKEKAFPILLAAPTGRAAKRMSEATDLPASTIHRLLGLNGREMPTELNAKDLEGALLIVDEMSMVDTLLFKVLVQSIPTSMHVIFVGDKDQLPSVGPGQIFHDLLAFGNLPQIELTRIHRQSADSTIIPLAHAIREGKIPSDLTVKMADRSFIACHSQQVAGVVKQIIEMSQQRGYDASDLQILAPMYRGAAGVDRLNELSQNVYNPANPNKQEIEFRGQVFRVGDKVLQLVNNPERNVFNGDIGRITSIENGPTKGKKNATMTIDFDGNEVNYGRLEWSQVRLAYSISIHKSQGSQFKMVILPLVHEFGRMLQRNLLYTAITRAADKLIMVGETYAFVTAINSQSVNRQTSLVKRLTDVWKHHNELKTPLEQGTEGQNDNSQSSTSQTDKLELRDQSVPNQQIGGERILTPALIKSGQIDPMIGMEGISPASFKK
ncbi:MAG: ATP-dependent RecD-like DNA helicase [Limosilactobacillus sp.]|uniref:SF1B family DNA helicase RecD2 n=1 Tax=Limosilactobacillus sp. TaxID=2773925 RepID=UPI0025BFB6F2|nr:ATP-dependent RecD-like DNA helicase [Limosilactobacillus sp.]MCI1975654.1 ATP-dependent RecD-like DNA helicase [Limosilactobacillus sp.]MCI2031435.1 ATP-dependent RecD-like DNA helicase [Limosilactobacillus sp.]